MSTFADRLVNDFADKEFAHGYMQDHGNVVIAAQIKALREQRGLSQEALAQLAGMKQERISTLENVEYDAWTIKTLRKLAEAFDVHLKVAFVPFSEGIMDAVNLRRERLEVVSREEDLAQFRGLRKVHSNGEWKAINGNHLSIVRPLPAAAPVNPTLPGWQRIDQGPSEVARG